jgi:hypothetical protein
MSNAKDNKTTISMFHFPCLYLGFEHNIARLQGDSLKMTYRNPQ